MADLGYYTVPVILSFSGVTDKAEKDLKDGLKKTSTQAGKDFGKDFGKAVGESVKPAGDGGKVIDQQIRESAKTTAKQAGTEYGKEYGKAVSDAVKPGGTAGKTIDQSLNQSAKQSGAKAGKDYGQAMADAVKRTGTRVGKEVSDALGRGAEQAGTKTKTDGRMRGGLRKAGKSAGEFFGSEFGKELTNTVATEVGHALGEKMRDIPFFQSVADAAGPATTALTGIRDAVAGIKANDPTAVLNSLQTALTGAQPIAAKFGADISSWAPALAGVQSKVEGIKGLVGQVDQLKGVATAAGLGGGTTLAAAGPLLAFGAGMYEFAPGYKQQIDSIRAQAQGKEQINPMPWLQQAVAGFGGGPGAGLASAPTVVGKEYDWVAQHAPSIGGFKLPKRPTWLGGEQDKTEYTRASGEKGHYWYAPGEAAKSAPAAAPAAGAVSTQQMAVSAGSVVVSGAVSLPGVSIGGGSAGSGSSAGSGKASGGKHWWATGGEIRGPGGPKSDAIPIWASNSEHMWAADEVAAFGGHDAMSRFRAAVRAGGKHAAGGKIGIGFQGGGGVFASMLSKMPDFTADSKGGKKGGDLKGMLAALAGIAEGGLLEGLTPEGFPNIEELAPVKMGAAALSAFMPVLEGAMKGKLGIQQPGWSPGQPISAPDAGGGGGMFGGMGGGGGGLGGAPTINIDQSQNISGNVGSDPATVHREHERSIARRTIPNIPTGF